MCFIRPSEKHGIAKTESQTNHLRNQAKQQAHMFHSLYELVFDAIHSVGIARDGAPVLQHAPDRVEAVPQRSVATLHGALELVRPKDQLAPGAFGRLGRVQAANQVVAQKEDLNEYKSYKL